MIFAVEGFLGNMLLRALSPPCHPSRILQLPLLPQVLQGAGMSPLTSGHPWHRPPLFPAEQRGAVEILKLTHLIALFSSDFSLSFFPNTLQWEKREKLSYILQGWRWREGSLSLLSELKLSCHGGTGGKRLGKSADNLQLNLPCTLPAVCNAVVVTVHNL